MYFNINTASFHSIPSVPALLSVAEMIYSKYPDISSVHIHYATKLVENHFSTKGCQPGQDVEFNKLKNIASQLPLPPMNRPESFANSLVAAAVGQYANELNQIAYLTYCSLSIYAPLSPSIMSRLSNTQRKLQGNAQSFSSSLCYPSFDQINQSSTPPYPTIPSTQPAGPPSFTPGSTAGGPPQFTPNSSTGGPPQFTPGSTAGGPPSFTPGSAAGGPPQFTPSAAAGGPPQFTPGSAAGGPPAFTPGYPAVTSFNQSAGGPPTFTPTNSTGGPPAFTPGQSNGPPSFNASNGAAPQSGASSNLRTLTELAQNALKAGQLDVAFSAIKAAVSECNK